MINTSIGMIGVALQADKATHAAAPTFSHSLTGGKTFQLDRSVENANVACGVRAGTDSYVKSIVPGLDYETYGYADVLPLYFYAAMGNIASAVNEGGSGHKHIITLGDTLPYLTFWGRIGGEYTRVDGGKVDTLELEFEGNSPLSFGVTVIGMDAEIGMSQFPGNIDPSCFDGYFVPTGGTFKLETSGAEPAQAAVLSGSLSLGNSCSADPLAGQVMPSDVTEGKLTSSGKVKVKPDDMGLYRKMVTGSESGTKPTGSMVYGSFSWVFKHSKNQDMTISIVATHVPFKADFPEVDPEGGAAEIEFSFDDIGITERNGSPVTVTVCNSTSQYVK